MKIQENSINKKLIGFDNEFMELKTLIDNNDLPNKMLFSGKKGIGKYTFAFHLINYILSRKEKNNYDFVNKIINIDNYSYKLISKNVHPNLFIIDIKENKLQIDISQIREMFHFTNQSSFNDGTKIILINNSEKLNLNSANAILKILEDPNDKILFILIHDNKKHIIDTIKSRCICYNLKLNNKNKDLIIKDLLPKVSLKNDFISYYSSPGEIINFYKFCIENNLDFENINIESLIKKISDESVIRKDKYVIDNFSKFIEIYFYKKINNSTIKNKYFELHNLFLQKIDLSKKYNLDLESVLIDFNAKIINE